MIRRITAAALLTLVAACRGNDQAGGSDSRAAAPLPVWTIGIGGDPGTLDAATTRAGLEAQFAGAVRDTVIHVGEGQFEPGTVIHPDDPQRRAEIIWQDSARTRPWRVQVAGDSSAWRVGPGITLGTTLDTLARLNGAPFPITGFGWDYGGTVMGWGGGALERTLLGGNGRVLLRLSPRAAAPDEADVRAVQGDGVFRSSDPAMQRLAPAVRQIIVEYDEP